MKVGCKKNQLKSPVFEMTQNDTQVLPVVFEDQFTFASHTLIMQLFRDDYVNVKQPSEGCFPGGMREFSKSQNLQVHITMH